MIWLEGSRLQGCGGLDGPIALPSSSLRRMLFSAVINGDPREERSNGSPVNRKSRSLSRNSRLLLGSFNRKWRTSKSLGGTRLADLKIMKKPSWKHWKKLWPLAASLGKLKNTPL